MTSAPAATKKKPNLAEVLDVLESLFGPPPEPERTEDPLIDHLLVAVMTPAMGQAAARDALRALSAAYLDWNEVRTCSLSELDPFLTAVPAAKRRDAAWNLRMALQDVFDGTHGLDLEPLRGRTPEDMRKFLKVLPNTHGGAVALMFQAAAGDDVLAFGVLEEHLLTRLGMLPRANGRDRIRAAMERQIKSKDRRRFAWLAGSAAHLYEEDFDPSHPFCALLVRLNAKELVVREQERKREEARRVVEEKKRAIEEEKRRRIAEKARAQAEKVRQREEAIAKRKADAAAKVAARKAEADAKIAARRAEIERKRAAVKAEADRKKAAAKAEADAKRAAQKAAADAKRAALKAAQAAKQAEARKVAAAKKAAEKKAAAQKRAAEKKQAAEAARKQAAAKKVAEAAKKKQAAEAARKKAAVKKAADAAKKKHAVAKGKNAAAKPKTGGAKAKASSTRSKTAAKPKPTTKRASAKRAAKPSPRAGRKR